MTIICDYLENSVTSNMIYCIGVYSLVFGFARMLYLLEDCCLDIEFFIHDPRPNWQYNRI